MKIAAIVQAGVFLLCASAALSQAQPLAARDAWVRAVPGSDMAAAYLSLSNSGPAPVTVVGVSSPAAASAMIHETSAQGGQSRMRPHPQLIIPAGQTIRFAPGGLHVMLHELKQPVHPGQSVPLIFQLADGGTLQVAAIVRPLTAD